MRKSKNRKSNSDMQGINLNWFGKNGGDIEYKIRSRRSQSKRRKLKRRSKNYNG